MTMITPSYLGETIEYSSLHACRSTLEDPTIDGGLLALLGLGLSYLIAVRDYLITRFLVVAVVLEAVAMATLGTTPVKLLSIAIAVNAALVPAVMYCVLRTIRVAPQAPGPPLAEG